MSKQPNQSQTSQRKPSESTKPSPYWGLGANDFYRGLANKPVKIIALDGKIYAGTLVGVDQYDLTLRQANELVILVPKHAIKYVHADSSGSRGVTALHKSASD